MRGFSKKQAAGFFLAGAAAGAVVALLYAPKSGAQTRKDVRKFSRHTADRLGDLQHDFRRRLNEGYEQVIEVFDTVKEYVEDGRNRLQKIMRSA